MKKIAAFIFTLGLTASYAFASDIGCSACEEEWRECTMQMATGPHFASAVTKPA